MDKFEQYYGYGIIRTTTDKEELLENFIQFLNNPLMGCGMFVVRWAENEIFENNMTLREYVDTNKKGE